MSLLNHLQLQQIDESSDDASDDYSPEDDILLEDRVDEKSLENFWDEVSKDIHQDPEWFSFADE